MSITCYPSNGVRKSEIKYVRKESKIQIISGIVLSVLLPLIFIYYYKDFKLHINVKVLILIIVILTLFH